METKRQTIVHTVNRYRAPLIALACAIGFAVGYLLGPTTESRAHVITPVDCQQAAVQQALAVLPATPDEVRTRRQACNRIAARHAVTHRVSIATTRCLARPSNITPTVCYALARAAVARNVDAWSWSPALHELLRRESTWSPHAVNERSGACGLGQRLPCPWRYYGDTSSPDDDRVFASAYTQSVNVVRYIAERYGSPGDALRFHDAHGWY